MSHRRRAAATATAIALITLCTQPAQAINLPPVPAQLPGQEIPVHHDGAPVPVPFSPHDYVGYISDISSHRYGIYLDVIDSFGAIRENPGVMSSNLEQVIAVNNAARNDPARIRRAQVDARADRDGVLDPVADALGPVLAQHFRDALAENRLPKTRMLLGGGWFARAGGPASSTFVEKEIFANPRPFVVAPDRITKFVATDRDFYSTSKSFPSGHTNQATWTTTLLAVMLPEFGPQILARGSEAGEHRLVMGVHYPLDVIGGRMTGTAAAADRWNDPKMRANLIAAAAEIRAELEWRCGASLAECASVGPAYSADPVGDYTRRMNYGFAPVGDTAAPMIVPQAAPDLLLGAFPDLSYAQRAEILRLTAGPAGMPLDGTGPEGSWQRLNLAAAMAAEVTVTPDGQVRLRG
ncbi:phosphatase PAP2 family protein [Corynebacterium sp. CCM 9185]|uniref:Phosphatase PAP2 family protein n=1 Tax=Corynebacterium marambiense TaxID=2765364 RepID=A0ABS0VRR7_9CORY|nr:phosphatase PAP2 family protein [Corynebacterium marambiense]MBI8999469.1 phosphatase PAP2 family protein [Corynebacterium marambiense]MCK7662307.1 phosphatase PAP2 family protein [Corynebacterium marambiense]MCX7541576.1 phosphatase PAP2 family protein [Corynebacterium marambiense]